ncbi:serine hydrolase [Rhodohalobacter sp.]|uniref:serine hydrolase domain-containing protein n=1 Tax=Rhodohalobacter sp. TaxID=1974210 RepID=UPI002ACE078F|nr:serine hydrolase [Rhodohalobacter sp.]MDZ7757050.1 serine hydrolase [Rhodohalobacter sp.]
MKQIAQLLLTFILISFFSAETLLSQDNSEELTQRVDEIFAQYDSSSVPGCAVSIFQDGQSILTKGYGIANLDYGIQNSDSTRFYMASVSKHITASAAELLIIRGQLSETDFLSDYVEDWPEWASEVQVQHLFNHTSGLPDIYGLMQIGGMDINDVMDLEDYMEVIKKGEELMFEPGSDFSYSNSGYTSLAYLVQEISGMSFPEFVEKEFFEPFGMNATHFHDDRTRIIPNRAISYQVSNGTVRRSYPGNFQGVGGGGLYTTHRDLEKWEQFWYGNLSWEGGITEQEAVELKRNLTAPTYADGEVIDYRKGLRVSNRKGLETVRHGGSFYGFKTNFKRYPQTGISMITTCNRGDADPGSFNDQIADYLLQDEFEDYLAEYSGRYINDELPAEYTLTVEEGNLHLERRLSPNGNMEEVEKDAWEAGSWDFEFFRNESGSVAGFKVTTGRAEDVEFYKADN